MDERTRNQTYSTKATPVRENDYDSRAAIERWLARFHDAHLSCGDQSRFGPPMIDFSVYLRPFFIKFPFTNAIMMLKHFHIALGMIVEILHRSLGLEIFSPQ
jgi:hypothetical protein